jgi:hypothetical protein
LLNSPILRIMSEQQLTGLQKRASKYIGKAIDYRLRSDEIISGTFVGFDKNNIDRAVIQISNAADKRTLPLMSVLSHFEGVDDE